MLLTKKNNKKNVIILLFILATSLVISFFVANGLDTHKDRNDLPMYENYYNCLNDDFNSIQQCNLLMGNPSGIVYQYSGYFFKIIMNINSFMWYIFFLSLFIYSLILYTTTKISPLPLLSLLFLFSDFRFWEFGNNILRSGLAMTLTMIVFYIILNKNFISTKLKFLLFIPTFAHTSALVFIIPRDKKYSFVFIIIITLMSIVSYIYFDDILKNILPYLPEKIHNKIQFYYIYAPHITTEIKHLLPLHYLLIMLISFILISKKMIYNKTFIYSFNITFILFSFSMILSILGVGYRIVGFMPPFIAILFSYEIKFLYSLFQNTYMKQIIYILALLFIIIISLKNYDLITKGFS